MKEANENARLTFMLARQTHGKTLITRKVREDHDQAGTPFPIINLETNKPGINKFIKKEVYNLPPTATSGPALHKFLFEMTATLLAEGSKRIVVDTNGEDERLVALCRDYPIAEILAEMKVVPQLFFIAGADVEDLKFLEKIDNTRSFAGATTILGFAQHSSRAPDPLEAYKHFKNDKLIMQISKRHPGNHKVLIPSCPELEQIQDVPARLHDIGRIGGFPAGIKAPDPWIRSQIGKFCRQLDEAFAPIKGVFP